MDERTIHVTRIYQKILGRNPSSQELSKYKNIGTDTLTGIVNTIKHTEIEANEEFLLIEQGKNLKKTMGVSFVSTYNVQCGIATYTENLYKSLRDKIPCAVISDESRNRVELSTEENVYPCWSKEKDDFDIPILKKSIEIGNLIIHFQHEFGLFKNNDNFVRLLRNLKKCGFIVVVTMHTVLVDNKHLDAYFMPADVMVLHSESAAARLYANGMNNLTVIPHGTEEGIENIFDENCSQFINQFIDYNPGEHILGCSVGFITSNKMQKEVLQAVSEAVKEIPNLKFLMIGSTARRDYDLEYLPKLKAFESDNIKVVQKFLTDKEIGMLLEESDFSIMNYEQTSFSISGASHLLMTYLVPSISSDSRILEDLTFDITMKINASDISKIRNAIIEMCNQVMDYSMSGKDNWYINSINSLGIKKQKTLWKNLAKQYLIFYSALKAGYDGEN